MVVSMPTRCLKHFLACGLFVLSLTATAEAQITPPSRLSASPSKTASLEEYLVNRLRATTPDQQSYVREIVRLQEQGRLEKRLLIALERYSRRKSPFLPLVVFERALKIEAGKRRVAVPTLRDVVARNGASAAQSISDSRNR